MPPEPLKISQLPDGEVLQDDDEFPVRRGSSNVRVRWGACWPVLKGDQWINIATLAKADVFVAPLMSGGDGVLDPVIGNVVAQFK